MLGFKLKKLKLAVINAAGSGFPTGRGSAEINARWQKGIHMVVDIVRTGHSTETIQPIDESEKLEQEFLGHVKVYEMKMALIQVLHDF